MNILFPFLVMVSIPVFGQAQDSWTLQFPQGRPTLVILEAGGADGRRPLTERVLLETEGLEEVQLLDVAPDPKDRHSQKRMEAFRSSYSIPGQRWALLGPDRTCLASGRTHLDAEGLKAALLEVHFQTPVQKLQAFLKTHPDHLEARQALLAHLRRTAVSRTRLVLGIPLPPEESGRKATLRDRLPKADSRLSPEQDLRIWDATCRELARAYQTGDWLLMDLPPEWDGIASFANPWESSPLEAASPSMKALFRQHRTTLLAALRETPRDRNLLGHWLLTSLALGEPLLPVFEGLTPPIPDSRLPAWLGWPGEPVRRALEAEAKAAGDWARLRRLLSSHWLDGARTRSLGDPHSRSAQWTESGLPALEACLRSGAPEEAGPILDSARDAPEGATFLAEAVALARRMGRTDLVKAWGDVKPRVPTPEPLGGTGTVIRSAKTATGTQLQFQDAENTTERPGFYYGLHTVLLHPEAHGCSLRAGEWREFLGWGALDSRWAVLDPKGGVLLEGLEPIDEPGVQKRLDGMKLPAPGWVPSRVWADALRGKVMDDPWLRLELALADLQGVTQTLSYLERAKEEHPRPGPTPKDDPASPDILEPLNGMDAILEEGLWQRASWRKTMSWSPSASRVEAPPALESMARKWVEALESALLRSPTRRALWSLWAEWMAFLPNHPLQPWLGQLEPDPMALGSDPIQGTGPWPPDVVLRVMTSQAEISNGWGALEQSMRPLWAEALEVALASGRNGRNPGRPSQSTLFSPLSAEFSRSGIRLAYALFKQGREEDADRVLEEALGAGLGSRKTAARQALFGGFKDLAEHWDPTLRKP